MNSVMYFVVPDVNECDDVSQNCSSCLNTNGSSICTCLAGFVVGYINGTTPDTPICNGKSCFICYFINLSGPDILPLELN